jgi:hypothetical protein
MVEGVVKTNAALPERIRLKQAQSRPKTCRGKKRSAAAYEFRHDIDFDCIQSASLDESHLQLPAAKNPHVSIIEASQLPDKVVDVAARL